MRKLTIVSIISSFIVFWCPLSGMAQCSLSEALMDKYGPYTTDTKISIDHEGVITQWVHGAYSKPNASEIATAIAECARKEKKEEIKAEAIRRALLIDEDFKEGNIGIYKKISVAALDTDGLAIRAILIYAKQKMTWVNTASLQDVNAYEPTTDVGWP